MCAHAVSVAIEKIEGVRSVRVSLEEGLGEIVLEEENTVDPEVFVDLIEDNGFTPGQMEITVAGRLQEDAGRHLILVAGPELVYELPEGAASLPPGAAPGWTVVVLGRVLEAASAAGTGGRLRLIEPSSHPETARPGNEDP